MSCLQAQITKEFALSRSHSLSPYAVDIISRRSRASTLSRFLEEKLATDPTKTYVTGCKSQQDIRALLHAY